MDPELAKTYLASFAPDQPVPRTSPEAGQGDKPRRNVETTENLAAESSLRPSAAAAGPDPKLYCDTCQSSHFESPAVKAATYTPSALNKHKLMHHTGVQTFKTWLIFHNTAPRARCYSCPFCCIRYERMYRLQIHLLEQYHNDVPTKLPVEIFILAYRLCVNDLNPSAREVALKYREKVMQLGKDGAAAPVRKALAEIREDGSDGKESREQGNEKTRKLEGVGC